MNCELKVDLCVGVSCENRGICQTVDMKWQCQCLDSLNYYGDHCQYKVAALVTKEYLSRSFAAVAIVSITITGGFIVIMDILKYFFHIDPVEFERDSYRRRRELLKQKRQPAPPSDAPRLAVRFQYVN